MKFRTILSILLLGVALSFLWGCVPEQKKDLIQLNLKPHSETVYKVVQETGKDYEFTQPSMNKTKEKRSIGRLEMIFAQNIEDVDSQGAASANITIKDLRYFSEDASGKTTEINSSTGSESLQPLVGQSYKIKISPNGKIEVIDANAARRAAPKQGYVKKIADKLLSDPEIQKRHQVLALMDASKALAKRGSKWSTMVNSPPGTLKPKTFEKTYTVTDIKEKNGQKIAIVTMNAEPSSKRTAAATPEESKMNLFTKMFEEKDTYTGEMTLNLTTGQIENYKELFNAEWIAVDTMSHTDKEPDQLTMKFWNLYSIEKVK